VRDLVVGFGERTVLDHVSVDVRRGEIFGFVGGSGSGKSVLLRTIIGLNRPAAGSIKVLGEEAENLDGEEWRALQARWGVLFQNGALFSSLTVAENVQAPMREQLDLEQTLMDDLAGLKIRMVGLPMDAAAKYPSQLSGGMKKRAGLARALALDPEIVFLDEPTAGLDPIGASEFDELVKSLRQSLGITVVMITHDLDTLVAICDRIAVLVDRKIKMGTMEELLRDNHPWIKSYFHGPRSRAAGIA